MMLYETDHQVSVRRLGGRTAMPDYCAYAATSLYTDIYVLTSLFSAMCLRKLSFSVAKSLLKRVLGSGSMRLAMFSTSSYYIVHYFTRSWQRTTLRRNCLTINGETRTRLNKYCIRSNFHGTIFSQISRSSQPSRKYILATILLNYTNIYITSLPFVKLNTRDILSNGNSQNIHPAKTRAYTVCPPHRILLNQVPISTDHHQSHARKEIISTT